MTAQTGERLTAKQVADRWRVSRSAVYALVAAGELPHLRVGLGRGTIRIAAADVERYERRQTRDTAAAFAGHFA